MSATLSQTRGPAASFRLFKTSSKMMSLRLSSRANAADTAGSDGAEIAVKGLACPL